jgi:hypothetical protein
MDTIELAVHLFKILRPAASTLNPYWINVRQPRPNLFSRARLVGPDNRLRCENVDLCSAAVLRLIASKSN